MYESCNNEAVYQLPYNNLNSINLFVCDKVKGKANSSRRREAKTTRPRVFCAKGNSSLLTPGKLERTSGNDDAPFL